MDKNRKSIFIFIFFSLLFYGELPAQVGQELQVASEKARSLSESPGIEADELAARLTNGLSSEKSKAYSIYYWIANNIDYDYYEAENVTLGSGSDDVVEEALRKRKGVCQHYAELFHALAERAGFNSLVVYGYVKQDGKIAKVPHAWNALEIDSAWYLFDPTWGAGYLTGTKYHRHFSEDYFMVKPREMIASHMPFDPLFQFLYYPVGHEEFKRGNPSDSSLYVDYASEIQRYLFLTEEESLPEAMTRVEAFGIANTMVRGYYSNLNQRHRVYLANKQIDMHNKAVDMFNEVVNEYNVYVNALNARGGRFPEDTRELEMLLGSIETKAIEVNDLFNSINPPMKLEHVMTKNQNSLLKLLDQVRKEQKRLQDHKH